MRRNCGISIQILLACSVFFFLPLAASATTQYPHIHTMDHHDVVYRQLQDDISRFNKAISRGKEPGPLTLYSVTVSKPQTLYTVAARLNLPYDALASLNGLDNPVKFHGEATLIVPGMPGIFVPHRPTGQFSRLLTAYFDKEKHTAYSRELVFHKNGSIEKGKFLIDRRFPSIVRAYFLKILFTYPLKEGILTSHYGNRINPVTGNFTHHNGIDIAAPQNSAVYAARAGTVITVQYDSILGNHVVIQHSGKYQTVYGHLRTFSIQNDDRVAAGDQIGTVGSTGMSTGPHLHFEIRSFGSPIDPEKLLPEGTK